MVCLVVDPVVGSGDRSEFERKKCYLVNFEGLEGFKDRANFLDFLVIIINSINSNFLLVKSYESS